MDSRLERAVVAVPEGERWRVCRMVVQRVRAVERRGASLLKRWRNGGMVVGVLVYTAWKGGVVGEVEYVEEVEYAEEVGEVAKRVTAE